MDKVGDTIKKYRLIRKGDKILVGVSGGPDSLFLLLYLFGLRSRLGIDLHIAHVDHALREGSSGDASFVKSWAQRLGIPISMVRLGDGLAGKKGSLEENCRKARIDFLVRVAKKIRADKIALGHNLDDQAETVLMRLLRGTGLSGLSGISLKRSIKGMIFIRPLLETSRKEINLFLKKKNVRPRIDPTNKEDIFFRNKIRNKLIPMLKKEYNHNISGVLASLSESASCDYEYLEQAARKALGGSGLSFELSKLLKLHLALFRLKIRQAVASIKGDTRRVTFQHIREIEDLLLNRPAGSIVDLPCGIVARKTRNTLKLYKR